MDPTILEQCIPGYESLTVSEENVFEGKIKLGIAVVKGIYEGKVRILDKYKPEHFKMVLDGKGTLGIIHREAIIYLSQKENCHRSWATGYFLNENKCFPTKTDLADVIDFDL